MDLDSGGSKCTTISCKVIIAIYFDWPMWMRRESRGLDIVLQMLLCSVHGCMLLVGKPADAFDTHSSSSSDLSS